MIVSRRHLLQAAAAWPLAARAQEWPPREVRIVVPAEAGGGMDKLARVLALQLQAKSDASFVVINRSGAGGNIGTASVAKAAPDGTTLLFTGLGHLANPLLGSDAGYDALQDFTPVAALASAPNALVVHASLKSVPPPRLWRQRMPDGRALAYASAGVGTTSHLAAELLMHRTGAQWLHVPYRGTSPALRALLAGEVQLMMLPVSSLATAVAGERAVAVAVAHATRLRTLPALPTLAELGVQGAEFAQWYGVYAPAGMPPATFDELSQRVDEARLAPALQQYLLEQSMEPITVGRDGLAAFVRGEQERLAQLIRRERQRPR